MPEACYRAMSGIKRERRGWGVKGEGYSEQEIFVVCFFTFGLSPKQLCLVDVYCIKSKDKCVCVCTVCQQLGRCNYSVDGCDRDAESLRLKS